MVKPRKPRCRTRQDYEFEIQKLEKMLWYKQQVLDWLSDEPLSANNLRRIESTKIHSSLLYQQLQELEEEYSKVFSQ